MTPGPLELVIILAIALLIFGGRRLRNMGGDIGSAIKGFKKAMREEGETNEEGAQKSELPQDKS